MRYAAYVNFSTDTVYMSPYMNVLKSCAQDSLRDINFVIYFVVF